METELFACRCEVLGETEKAIKIQTLDGEELWLPLSQVSRIDHPNSGPATVHMSAWLAKKKGLV